MDRKLFGISLLAISTCLFVRDGVAFEIKGYSPGADVSTVDTSLCRGGENIDSGIPGFTCDTTLAGEKAELRLAVFDGKLVAIIFRVAGTLMTPTLDALSQKYGTPTKPNRFIEDYSWSRGNEIMSIKESRLTNGYQVLLMDFALFRRARDAAAAKAKKDI